MAKSYTIMNRAFCFLFLNLCYLSLLLQKKIEAITTGQRQAAIRDPDCSRGAELLLTSGKRTQFVLPAPPAPFVIQFLCLGNPFSAPGL